MDFLLISIGSHGDVHPFVGLGLRLQQRGHRVRIISNAHFRPLIEAAGLELIELGPADEYLELARSPDLWNPRRAVRYLFGHIGRNLEQVHAVLEQQVGGDTVVVSSSLCLGARIAEDKLGFLHATVHLAPSLFRSAYHNPRLALLFMPRWLPKWIKRAVWSFGDRFIVDPIIAPQVNALRAKLGLDPVRFILRDWWHAPRLTIGMFPDWFGRRQPDWPTQLRLTGFPLYDERGVSVLPEHVEQFLCAGEPPVAFTPGSAMFDGEQFFRAAVDACQRLRIRGILLTRHDEQVPRPLPGNVIHADFAPFSQLLPRVAAMVHHGGIGTSSQCLAAGVPALIMPMCHDQLDNAERLCLLGVAVTLRRSRFTGRNVAAALDRLLRQPQYRGNAQALAARVAQSDGLAETCDVLETLAPPLDSHAVTQTQSVVA